MYYLTSLPFEFLLAWCAIFTGLFIISKEFKLSESFYKRQNIRQALHLQEIRRVPNVEEDK